MNILQMQLFQEIVFRYCNPHTRNPVMSQDNIPASVDQDLVMKPQQTEPFYEAIVTGLIELAESGVVEVLKSLRLKDGSLPARPFVLRAKGDWSEGRYFIFVVTRCSRPWRWLFRRLAGVLNS